MVHVFFVYCIMNAKRTGTHFRRVCLWRFVTLGTVEEDLSYRLHCVRSTDTPKVSNIFFVAGFNDVQWWR